MKYLNRYATIIAINSMLASTAQAIEYNNFYLKLATGLNNVDNVKIDTVEHKGTLKAVHSFPLVEMGIGYNLPEGIRSELVFDHYFLFHSKEKTKNDDGDVFNVFTKTKADALMLNAYKDVFTLGKFTPFLGGGIGISFLRETGSGYVIFQDEDLQIHHKLNNVTGKFVKRFAYKLSAGVDITLSNNIKAEISYNHFNLGKNKPRKTDGIDEIHSREYKIHNILIGLKIFI